MDYFYVLVLLFAFVLLIISLVVLGYLMKRSGAATIFPSTRTQCPDQWTVIGNSCALTSKINDVGNVVYFNSGNISLDVSSGIYKYNKLDIYNYSDTYPRTFKFLDNSENVCELKKWAIANEIKWDSVTNYNNCV